jgi:DNA-binding response OmpR family regulator
MTGEKRAKILVVDDEAALGDFLEQVLTADGYSVRRATDGRQALTVARAENPDLILMDIMMPNLNGIEACRQLRAQPATRDIPILMLTGYNTRDRLEESIIAGADDFLGKPVDLVELRVRVRAMLKVRDKLDEAARLEAYIQEMKRLRRPGATNPAPPETRPT